jgi:hypothetical protein
MLARGGGLVCVVLMVGCASLTERSTAITSTTVPTGGVSCEPSPRFRLDGVEYEVQAFDDVVEVDQVGDIVAEALTLPPAVKNCESFVVLQDGEGTLPAGTTVYMIVGVNVSEALTASLGGDVYLRFRARN